MSTATTTSSSPLPLIRRAYASHTPQWQRFQTDRMVVATQSAAALLLTNNPNQERTHPYQRQFSHVYHQRLAVLGPQCWKAVDAAARREDNDDNDNINNGMVATKVDRLLDLREGVLSVAVGTLVKEAVAMTNSSADKGEGEKGLCGTECRDKDELYLEDASGRIGLATSFLHQWTTGGVVAVRGMVTMEGVLQVDEIYAPAWMPPPPPLLVTENPTTGPDSAPPMVLLASGLSVGSADFSSLSRDMLVSYLQGHLGHKAASIQRVILAGGLVDKNSDNNNNNNTINRNNHKSPGGGAYAIKELDGFLLQVAASGIPMDVLPGASDPTTANWPQRPIHKALLPQTNRHFHQLLHCTPNPYAAQHGNVTMVGTDGTNIKDMQRRLLHPSNNNNDDDDDNNNNKRLTELDVLERCLQWAHLCPTGPQHVPTMPHGESDPMVLTKTPHLLFAGKSRQFATSLVNGCRCVCVPDFAVTGQVVLVDLASLRVEVVRFEI